MAGLSPFGGPFSSMIMGERVPSLNPTASLPPEMVRFFRLTGVWGTLGNIIVVSFMVMFIPWEPIG